MCACMGAVTVRCDTDPLRRSAHSKGLIHRTSKDRTMNLHFSSQTLAILALFGALSAPLPASAQVAGGTTTIDATVTASTQLAMGWSVKKTLMGKTVYNDQDQSVGKLVMAGAIKDRDNQQLTTKV